MVDTYEDGWNDNVLAFKQGSVIVATFGSTFTSGATKNESVTIPSGVLTQIVVDTVGYFGWEVGYTIRFASNNSILTSRAPGSSFTSSIVFFAWCPNCVIPKVIYTI